MRIYEVKNGESIGDVALNACGNISAWGDILNLNAFTEWVPTLTAGQVLQVPDIVDSYIYDILQIYPACNRDWTSDNDTDLNILIRYIQAVIPVPVDLPVITPASDFNYYIIRPGDTIGDVSLNATGTINNWEKILTANAYTEWVPALTAGQQVIIPPDVEMQSNVKRELNIYPACNAPNISDLSSKINQIISIFVTAKMFEEGVLFQFEELADYQFEL